MNTTDKIAMAALIFSLISLGWQIFAWWKDRTKISTRSSFYTGNGVAPERYLPSLFVSIAVDGPRAVVLRLLCLRFEDGQWSGTYIGDTKTGTRLSDGGHFEMTMSGEDLSTSDDRGYFDAVEIFFKDSLGREHVVKNSRENLIKVRAEEREFYAERKAQRLAEQAAKKEALASDPLITDH